MDFYRERLWLLLIVCNSVGNSYVAVREVKGPTAAKFAPLDGVFIQVEWQCVKMDRFYSLLPQIEEAKIKKWNNWNEYN